MLITLTQLKKSLQALKDFLLAKITVKDVQVNGTSILDEGVANIPTASATTLGAVKVGSNWGVRLTNNEVVINPASSGEIKSGNNGYKPITPGRQNESTFYGLAKAAGDTTQSASSNPVGTYTDDAKTSIKTMLGVKDPVDVQINGTSIVNEGVASIDIGTGLVLGTNNIIMTDPSSINELKNPTGLAWRKPVGTDKINVATFYGLAKAAGDTTQSASSNAVGTYTDDAKTSIKTMLGVEDPVDVQINGTSIVDNGVANIPVASGGNLGVVKTFNGNFYGINVYSGELRIVSAPDSDIKSGWGSYQPITAGKQHTAVFYGLAKAAGHDEKSSTLPVGTYTDEAKAAIKTMLGITVDSIPTTEIDTLFA